MVGCECGCGGWWWWVWWGWVVRVGVVGVGGGVGVGHGCADLGNFHDADNMDRIAELTLKHGKMELAEYPEVDTEHAEHSQIDITEATE